ncbi:MAG: hypothetical protein JNM59_03635 [Hyphomonadaceae bacterium]|nr:hypothetical protein [Hyphomonadaceae bacterium]
MRVLILAAALCGLVACGDAQLPADLDRAKESAINLGQEAVEAASSVVDTRTACTLAGQSDAFCGCLQTRLGPQIRQEHIEALTNVIRGTLNGDGVQATIESAQGIDQPTREALLQCATSAAVEGAGN